MSIEKLLADKNVDVVTMDGENYISRVALGGLLGIDASRVSKFCLVGNRNRLMESRKIAGRLFIPVSEITEYPFSDSGPHGKSYHYNDKLERVDL